MFILDSLHLLEKFCTHAVTSVTDKYDMKYGAKQSKSILTKSGRGLSLTFVKYKGQGDKWNLGAKTNIYSILYFLGKDINQGLIDPEHNIVLLMVASTQNNGKCSRAH